jgi:hypothetical protein
VIRYRPAVIAAALLQLLLALVVVAFVVHTHANRGGELWWDALISMPAVLGLVAAGLCARRDPTLTALPRSWHRRKSVARRRDLADVRHGRPGPRKAKRGGHEGPRFPRALSDPGRLRRLQG